MKEIKKEKGMTETPGACLVIFDENGKPIYFHKRITPRLRIKGKEA